jgi:hypothetical protein
MTFLRMTKGLAVTLTMANAVIWTWQGHWIAGLMIFGFALAANRWLPEE